MSKNNFKLVYYFDKHDAVPFEYFVNTLECVNLLIDNQLVSKDFVETLSNTGYLSDLLVDFEDYLHEYFYEDAQEQYNDEKEEDKDPYRFRGVSPKDFY